MAGLSRPPRTNDAPRPSESFAKDATGAMNSMRNKDI